VRHAQADAVTKKTRPRKLPGSHSKPELGSTKERILQIAEELFAERGFEGARTRDIAERAEINISTLHFHWTSKEELYAAVYRRLLAQRAELAEEIFALLASTPQPLGHWQDTVQTVVDKMFTFFRVHTHAARLDIHRLLDRNAPNPVLDQGQAGTLLISVTERLRMLLPKELTQRLDVELTILSVNSFLREYFTNPAAFGALLGESNLEALEKRVQRHVRQMVARLYDLL
jgi:AcrR family transcriptional regulator